MTEFDQIELDIAQEVLTKIVILENIDQAICFF